MTRPVSIRATMQWCLAILISAALLGIALSRWAETHPGAAAWLQALGTVAAASTVITAGSIALNLFSHGH